MDKLLIFGLNGLEGATSQGNPRKLELQARDRSGEITEEERAELIGIYAFPDNPDAAELRRKEVLGLLTDEERAKLIKYYSRQNFSHEMQSILDRRDAQDPNVHEVFMNCSSIVEVKGEEVIYTYGLNGCFASAIAIQSPDGSKRIQLSHYDPLSHQQHLQAVQSFLRTRQEGDVVHAVISPAGGYKEQPKGGFAMTPHDIQRTEQLLSALSGADSSVDVHPYNDSHKTGVKDQGVMLIKTNGQDLQGRIGFTSFNL